MNTKKLKCSFEIPEISFWTWPIWWMEKAEKDEFQWWVELIKYAIEKWLTSIDTAELYWCGFSEEILWEAIKNYKRENLFIASKVKWNNCSYEAIKQACKNSLKRIWTSYLDLYYIHRREEQFDLKKCMKAMEELKDEWLIKEIAVSNFSKETLKEAQSYCKKYKIVANQVHYNLIFREVEASWLLEYCQKNDVMLVAYRPIELWKLANWANIRYSWLTEKYKKTSAQLSINWLISQKNVCTIFNCLYKNQIDENIWAVGFYMDKEDIEYLRKNYKWQINVSDCIKLA